jgi:hypothetical protein
MTRIRRIYADFDPACGVIGIGLATKAQRHKDPKEPFSVQPTLCLCAFVAEKLLPQAKENPRKSA